jgi:hypothetical protein
VDGLELLKSTSEIQRKEPTGLEEKEKENKTLRGGQSGASNFAKKKLPPEQIYETPKRRRDSAPN